MSVILSQLLIHGSPLMVKVKYEELDWPQDGGSDGSEAGGENGIVAKEMEKVVVVVVMVMQMEMVMDYFHHCQVSVAI